jgi:hypothetical protein
MVSTAKKQENLFITEARGIKWFHSEVNNQKGKFNLRE